MKERPILMSAPMVRAILAGTKTQTRRTVKHYGTSPSVRRVLGPHSDGQFDFVFADESGHIVACPYGRVGERLWVREPYRFLVDFDGDSPSAVGERCVEAGYIKPWAPTQYEADGARRNWEHTSTPPHSAPPTAGKLRSGMFMPRWASRITVEITGVRVERLQSISDEDVIAEGCKVCPKSGTKPGYVFPGTAYDQAELCHSHPITAFEIVWTDINGRESWESNPWVWAITFKRVGV